MKISIYTDGGSRGNPGPSGFGVVVYDEDKNVIGEISKFIGTKTNNEAEYSALNEALSWVQNNKEKLSIDSVDFYSDSQLLVRQMQDKYKVKAPTIVPLYRLATSQLFELKITYKFHEILRDLNSAADALANKAMDLRK
jgi:probable phosphoglycerate mutase